MGVRTVSSAHAGRGEEPTSSAAIGRLRLATQRRRRTAEDFYLSLFEKLPNLIWRSGLDAKCNYFNNAWLAFTGRTLEQELGDGWTQGVHPEDFDRCLKTYLDAFARREPFVTEYRLRHCGGDYRWIVDYAQPITDASGQFAGYLSSGFDIDDRKRVEEALLRSEQNLAEAQRIAHIGSYEYDVRTDRLFWSDEVFRICGISPRDFCGRGADFADRFHPDDRGRVTRAVDAAIAAREPFDLEHRIVRPDGSVRYVHERLETVFDGNGQPMRIIGTIQDITEGKQSEDLLRQMQDQLQQAQRMEAIGRLAGGIAHDFNNLLTAILGYGQFLLDSHPPGDPLHGDIQEVMNAGERAAGLTRQLLAFSRRQVLEPRVLDLNDTIANVSKLLHRVIGEDVELAIAAGRHLWRVTADPGQIEQVLMNLAVNARDAMPHGGRLTIETTNVTLDERAVRVHPVMTPGTYVSMTVTDTGVGMSPEVRARAFEPFFTTKEAGRGTGLGLATVYGIVKQSNGFIWCYSEPGRGTRFEILLPRVEGEAETRVVISEETDVSAHGETILLVEDDAAVRELAGDLLRTKGYAVLEATNGAGALDAAARFCGPIHLLLTDVVMPGISGREVAERIRAQRPEMRVLYMSGYTDDAIGRRGVLERGTRFLQKPFTASTLLGRVRDALSGEMLKRQAWVRGSNWSLCG